MENTSVQPNPRLLYIDNVRLLVIIFVIMHHLAITYGGPGGFYYSDPAKPGPLTSLWFTFYLGFQQSYFMGLLFLIAGYFAALSYDKKGFGKFIRDRFIRLIIPTLIYMVILVPIMEYLELGGLWKSSVVKVSWLGFFSSTGVMWFAVALFIFCLIYGLARKTVRKDTIAAPKDLGPAGNSRLAGNPINITFLKLLALIFIIAACAFVIRIFWPIGTSVLNMQLCYFASYIILFAVGVCAYRRDIFSKLTYRQGKRWLILGTAGSLFLWICMVILLLATGNQTSGMGGFNVYSFIYALWESFTAVAVSVGLLGVFKEKLNRQSKPIKAASDSSFAVYMFHPLILVGAAVLFTPVHLPNILKWIIMCLICVPLCFAAGCILRRIPLLKRVL